MIFNMSIPRLARTFADVFIVYNGTTYNAFEDGPQAGIYDVTGDNNEWRIALLADCTVYFSASTTIDIFAVGGGGGGSLSGGGGGGGYTKTMRGMAVALNENYPVTIGAGGAQTATATSTYYAGNDGGASSFANLCVALGGKGGEKGTSTTSTRIGGAGGSGGGGYAHNKSSATTGGADGADGATASAIGGAGQGTTTREFGEASGALYAGGGGGGAYSNGSKDRSGGDGGGGKGALGTYYSSTGVIYISSDANAAVAGVANTGGGGGGCPVCGSRTAAANARAHGAAGGSGIVVIRNAR